MITPPKKSTLIAAKILALAAACLIGPTPTASAFVAISAVVIVVLGCELKGL